MPQDVRYGVFLDSCFLEGSRETFAHRLHRLAVPLDDGVLRDAKPMPSPQMRKNPGRQLYRRLPLFRLFLTLGMAIEHTMFEVDVPPANGWLKGCSANCRMTRARVQTDKDEPGNVLKRLS